MGAAALVVCERDGIVVDSNLQIGQIRRPGGRAWRRRCIARRGSRPGPRGSATSRSCSSRRRAVASARSGGEDLVLVVVAEPAANVGLLRVELLRAVGERSRRRRGGLMQMTAVEPWIEAPLKRFVDDARAEARAAARIRAGRCWPSMASRARWTSCRACALAAAIHASAAELGRQLDGDPFRGLHHAGQDASDLSAAATDAAGRLHPPDRVRSGELAGLGAAVLRGAA